MFYKFFNIDKKNLIIINSRLKQLLNTRIFLTMIVVLIFFVFPEKIIGKGVLALKTNVTSVLMGRSIQLTVHLDLESGISAKDYLLLP